MTNLYTVLDISVIPETEYKKMGKIIKAQSSCQNLSS